MQLKLRKKLGNQRWEFINENKKVRKKERKHALDQDLSF